MIELIKAFFVGLPAAQLPEREEGQGMVEYSLIIGVISIVVVLAFMATDLGTAVGDLSQSVIDNLSPAPATP